MTTITIQEQVDGIEKSFKSGYDLALAMRNKYKKEIIEKEYYDIHELSEDQITDEMIKNIQEAKNTPKDLYTNL